MPYVSESKHNDQALQAVRIYNAADEALQVLETRCGPVSCAVDAAAIARAKAGLRHAMGREPDEVQLPTGAIADADKLALIQNLVLRAQQGAGVLDLTALLPRLQEVLAR